MAVKETEKYEAKIEKKLNFEMGGKLYGSGLKERYIDKILEKK